MLCHLHVTPAFTYHMNTHVLLYCHIDVTDYIDPHTVTKQNKTQFLNRHLFLAIFVFHVTVQSHEYSFQVKVIITKNTTTKQSTLFLR